MAVRVTWDLNQLGEVHCDRPDLASCGELVGALRELGFEPRLSEAPAAAE